MFLSSNTHKHDYYGFWVILYHLSTQVLLSARWANVIHYCNSWPKLTSAISQFHDIVRGLPSPSWTQFFVSEMLALIIVVCLTTTNTTIIINIISIMNDILCFIKQRMEFYCSVCLLWLFLDWPDEGKHRQLPCIVCFRQTTSTSVTRTRIRRVNRSEEDSLALFPTSYSERSNDEIPQGGPRNECIRGIKCVAS